MDSFIINGGQFSKRCIKKQLTCFEEITDTIGMNFPWISSKNESTWLTETGKDQDIEERASSKGKIK